MRDKLHQFQDDQDGAPPTVAVGARQFGQLKHRWFEYRSITGPRNGPIDPLEALHSTGALLHAVGDAISSEETAATKGAPAP